MLHNVKELYLFSFLFSFSWCCRVSSTVYVLVQRVFHENIVYTKCAIIRIRQRIESKVTKIAKITKVTWTFPSSSFVSSSLTRKLTVKLEPQGEENSWRYWSNDACQCRFIRHYQDLQKHHHFHWGYETSSTKRSDFEVPPEQKPEDRLRSTLVFPDTHTQ